MAISYDELKDRISSLQSNISSLNFQIREAESSISRLTREKKVLQIRTSELRSKIHTQKSAQYNHQSQIDNAARVQSDISVLQSHANSTSSNVQDVAAELQRLKQNLDRCAAVLSGETTQLRSETSVVERGVPMNVRLVRAFKREQTAVMKATRALELVHLKVPELLPGSNMKFLELEVSSRSVSGAIASEMPPVALITAGSGENVTRKDLT
jgi:predicted RNase H-like nuclease (RuvC/YqgF family)